MWNIVFDLFNNDVSGVYFFVWRYFKFDIVFCFNVDFKDNVCFINVLKENIFVICS